MHPVAQRGQYRSQITTHRLDGIHGHAQFIQRSIRVLAQLGVGAAFANEAEQPHQLRTHAVVNVAHDALALQERGMLGVLLLQQGVADLQLLLALANLLVQRIAQALVGTHLPGVAVQDEPSHEQHEQHGGQWQIRRTAHTFCGHPNFQEIVKSCADGNKAGKTQRDGFWLPGHQRLSCRNGIRPECRHKQQCQGGSPAPGLPKPKAPHDQ
ncbi:hypothetical protein ASE39_04655 [Acidovorax sp. Root267]|nr:hypothetical protein ASE39_04655 [Acidovorax sp. Root267]